LGDHCHRKFSFKVEGVEADQSILLIQNKNGEGLDLTTGSFDIVYDMLDDLQCYYEERLPLIYGYVSATKIIEERLKIIKQMKQNLDILYSEK
jgi:hypothetical protein